MQSKHAVIVAAILFRPAYTPPSRARMRVEMARRAAYDFSDALHHGFGKLTITNINQGIRFR